MVETEIRVMTDFQRANKFFEIEHKRCFNNFKHIVNKLFLDGFNING
jgi:hypothetical protein